MTYILDCFNRFVVRLADQVIAECSKRLSKLFVVDRVQIAK